MEAEQTKVRPPPHAGVSVAAGTHTCRSYLQVYVLDPNVSWVEATITKGHVVNEKTVEVVLAADEAEENQEKHPEAGLVRTVSVSSFIDTPSSDLPMLTAIAEFE